MKQFSSYINSNKNYYIKMVDNYYDSISQAKNQKDFLERLTSFCNRYISEVFNNEIMEYVSYNGYLDEGDYKKINEWKYDNLGETQKAFLNAELQEGKRYTLVYFNDFGFPLAYKITFNSVEVATYAQYRDAVKLIYKRKGGRKLLGHYFYNTEILIYEGWKDLAEEVTYIKEHENKNVSVKTSKYRCFDKRYIEDCIKYLGNPILKVGC